MTFTARPLFDNLFGLFRSTPRTLSDITDDELLQHKELACFASSLDKVFRLKHAKSPDERALSDLARNYLQARMAIDLDPKADPLRTKLVTYEKIVSGLCPHHAQLNLYKAARNTFGLRSTVAAMQKLSIFNSMHDEELFNLFTKLIKTLPKEEARSALNMLVAMRRNHPQNLADLSQANIITQLISGDSNPQDIIAALKILKRIVQAGPIDPKVVSAIHKVLAHYFPDQVLKSLRLIANNLEEISLGTSIDALAVFGRLATDEQLRHDYQSLNETQQLIFGAMIKDDFSLEEKIATVRKVSMLHSCSLMLNTAIAQSLLANVMPHSADHIEAAEYEILDVLNGNDTANPVDLKADDVREKYNQYIEIIMAAFKHLEGVELKKVLSFVDKLERGNLHGTLVSKIKNDLLSALPESLSKIGSDQSITTTVPDDELKLCYLLINRLNQAGSLRAREIFGFVMKTPEHRNQYIDYLLNPTDQKLIDDLISGNGHVTSLASFLHDKITGLNLNLVRQQIRTLRGMGHPNTTILSFIRAELAGNLQPEHYRRLLGRAAVFNLSKNQHVNDSNAVLNHDYVVDSPPYSLHHEQDNVERVHREALEHFDRVFDIHYGFSPVMFEARRKPDKGPSSLERFARDSAKKYYYANSSSGEEFPGKGLCVDGLDIPSIVGFSKRIDRQLYADQIREQVNVYKQNIPWLATAIDDAAYTSYIFLRGMMVITPPMVSSYELTGRQGDRVHYSMVVYNDHFHNDGLRAAYMVPTEVVNDMIGPSLIPELEFRGFTKQKIDLTKVDLSPKDFVAEANRRNMNVLDIGAASNLAGLCNAYPPKSKPYHNWEVDIGHSHYTDGHGHRHKDLYFRRSGYGEINGAELKLLQKAHTDLVKLSKKHYDLLNVFRLGLANRHKGISYISDRSEFQLEDDIIPEDLEQETAFLDSEEFSEDDIGDASKLSLYEAYRWHRELQEDDLFQGTVTKPDKFPVLAVSDTFNWGGQVSKPSFMLDTYDMKFYSRKPGGDYSVKEFDTTKPGEMEEFFWNQKILPILTNPGLDLRFYHRDDLKGVLPT